MAHNHAPFVKEALYSVLHQTYSAVEMILVDIGSEDNTRELMADFAEENNLSKTLWIAENIGNTAAFNRALALVSGEYLIDFSTDDLFLPHKLEEQVALFERIGDAVGLVYTNAAYIDERGRFIGYHHRMENHRGRWPVYEGAVFKEVLGEHFISSPSIMIRKRVLADLGGYNEDLSYEDFDLLINASRKWEFRYLDQVTVLVRKHNQSLSRKLARQTERKFESTFQVLHVARQLVRSDPERAAWLKRIKWEIRQAILLGCKKSARMGYQLLEEEQDCNSSNRYLQFLLWLPVNLRPFYLFYGNFRKVFTYGYPRQ